MILDDGLLGTNILKSFFCQKFRAIPKDFQTKYEIFSVHRLQICPTAQYSKDFGVGCAVIFTPKQNEAKRKHNFFSMRKTVFFGLFCIDAKHRNQKRNETELKQKQNKKEAKTAIIFASRLNEEKRKRNFFRFYAKKMFFVCFCIWSETKMKLSEIKMKKK